MTSALAEAVRVRANFACEYCRLPEESDPTLFEIEHIIALQHLGPTVFGNLAYSCINCNRHKGPNLAGIDRLTSRTRIVRLFNPRQHRWSFHFAWDGPLLVGRTPIGRVTVYVLNMIDPIWVRLRDELSEEGWNPG